MVKNSKFGLAMLILLVVLITGSLISGCNMGELLGGESRADMPSSNTFLAPLGENGNPPQVLAGSPVQIMSQHVGENLTRVELWTKPASAATEELVRADLPENGRVRQQWTPATAESYLIRVKAFDNNNVEQSNFETTIVAISSGAISIEVPTRPEDAPAPPPSPSQQDAFQPPLPSDLPVCVFGTAGAPRLNSLEVGNIALGMFNITNQSTAPVEVAGNAQRLRVSWNVSGANQVSIVMSDSQGNQESLTSSDAVGSVEFQAKESGLVTIVFTASNDTCQALTTRQIALNAQFVNIPTETPTAVINAVPAVVPTPSPTAFYPPPLPIPGVPFGPLQEQLPGMTSPPCEAPCKDGNPQYKYQQVPELMPPTCDAAEYLGVYVPADTENRIFITEPDVIAARTTGGTVVHRAWRLRNIGTCMWGPGYELAFYGGRAMGAGGISFEQEYPPFNGRPNIVAQTDRLIVPQGMPNETAVLELLLKVPSTPGIHQSYWRMRNPQGVYFGPILGVTLEVVRECEPGIYGAPVINRFQVKFINKPTTPGIDVFRPDNPKDIEAELFDQIQLEWSIINATSYDIIVTNPNGESENVKTQNTTDDRAFIVDELGEWFITLYVDNGPCSYSDQVRIDVFPPNNPALFPLAVQSSAVVNTYDVAWSHPHEAADMFTLTALKYVRQIVPDCWFGDFGENVWPEVLCSETGKWSDWQPVVEPPFPGQLVGVSPAVGAQTQPPNLWGESAVIVPDGTTTLPVELPENAEVQGATIIYQGEGATASKVVGQSGDNQHRVEVTNIEWGLCSPNDADSEYGIRFQMIAKSGIEFASPAQSLPIDCLCGDPNCGHLATTLPEEIPDQLENPPFNPGN